MNQDDRPAAAPFPDPAPATAVPYAPPVRRSRGKLILALVLLAFVGGVIVTAWGPSMFRTWWNGAPARPVAALSTPEAPASATPPPSAQDVAALEARIATVTARIEDASTRARHASAYASRAEALMIAFAARRALDSGAPLGYIENELRVRFAQAQPRAVATIITAANEPVTLLMLQAGLDEATPALMREGADGDWWDAAAREMSNMFIVRRASAPSRIPQKALEQARALLLAGRVDAALAEVERLPGHARADGWMQMARRYNEARRALDVIEAAAILEPRAVPMGDEAPAPAAPARAAPTPPPVSPSAPE